MISTSNNEFKAEKKEKFNRIFKTNKQAAYN